MPKALRDALVVALKAGDVEAARASLEADPAPFTARKAVQEALADAPTVDRLIEAGVRAKIGRALSIPYKGQVREMIPRGITNGVISVEVYARTHEIVIADLPIDEKLAFAAEPKTEGEHLTYCLMLMGSSRKNEVPKFAGKCPALKDLIVATAGK